MKKTLFIWLLSLLCFGLSLQAQNITQQLINIDGYITEEDSITPLDYATIQLYALPDSSFIKGTTSNLDGHFIFINSQLGVYFLKISSVGYNTRFFYFQITDTTQIIHLGKLVMDSSATMLQGAEVVAQVPAVVQKGDTTTYNASVFKVAEGSALEELVQNLPGAELDDNGNLIINGQKVTKVMMDGQEFFIRDLNSAMKDIPADMIEKLQVYHRKSDKSRATGIDDGNDDFVLDLRVKPDRKQGWNGNIMVGYGNDGQYQGKTQANRFKKKMNLSLNANADNNGIKKGKKMNVNYSQRSDKWNIGSELEFNRSDYQRWRVNDEETLITDSTSQFSHWDSNSSGYSNAFSANLRME